MRIVLTPDSHFGVPGRIRDSIYLRRSSTGRSRPASVGHMSFYTGQSFSEVIRKMKRSVSLDGPSFLLFVRLVLPESAQEASSGRDPGGLAQSCTKPLAVRTFIVQNGPAWY